MVSMKKKILFIIACLSLLSINGLLMSIGHAQSSLDEESEIVQADSYFNDDASNAQPLMYDDNGNVINPVATNNVMNGNSVNEQLDDVDRGAAFNNFGDEVNTDANTDSELVSGSAPIYNQ